MEALWPVLTLVLLAALLVALVGWERARGRVGRANRRRQRVARRGESAAEVLLAELGYEVVDRQVHQPWTVTVDGHEHTVAARLDLLVERGGLCYAAEVKTGSRAPDPTRPTTRRQLLEYQLLFDVDGVLLVDMEAGVVHTVELSILSAPPRAGPR